jgi:hypothetical protein
MVSGLHASKPRGLYAVPLSVASLAAAAAAPLALPAPALAQHRGHAKRKHHKPPKFAGLKTAVTCLPGPSGPGRESSYRLSWEAASDEATPAAKIVYEVYQATTSGGENFAKPSYTSAPGATSFDTPELPSQTPFFFVVRARDRAGREDKNLLEREGENLCV